VLAREPQTLTGRLGRRLLLVTQEAARVDADLTVLGGVGSERSRRPHHEPYTAPPPLFIAIFSLVTGPWARRAPRGDLYALARRIVGGTALHLAVIIYAVFLLGLQGTGLWLLGGRFR